MKKLICILCAIIFTLSLAACGNEGQPTGKTASSPKTESAANEETSSKTPESKTESASNGETSSKTPGTVIVPNVIGMNKDKAIKELEVLGLNVETEIRHWGRKGNKSTGEYEDDLIIVEQDLKEGVVVIPDTTISITINSRTNRWEYTSNSDGTITLTHCMQFHLTDECLQIPKTYENKVVFGVTSQAIQEIIEDKNIILYQKIKVPNEVNIIGEKITTDIEYY